MDIYRATRAYIAGEGEKEGEIEGHGEREVDAKENGDDVTHGSAPLAVFQRATQAASRGIGEHCLAHILIAEIDIAMGLLLRSPSIVHAAQ